MLGGQNVSNAVCHCVYIYIHTYIYIYIHIYIYIAVVLVICGQLDNLGISITEYAGCKPH